MSNGREQGGGHALPKAVMARRLTAILNLLLVLVVVPVDQGAAEIYTWVDGHGQVHFTDEYALVPPEYRDVVQSRPSSPLAESPLPPVSSPKAKKGTSAKVPSPRLSATGGQAKVVAVLDGDTIVISGGQKVRYAGMYTISPSI